MIRPKIVGIVNITTDSFSDGGKFIEPAAAIEHARALIKDGADIVELSGASSNPRSHGVSAEMQIGRIAPVLQALECSISVDATNTEAQRFALAEGAAYLNDIRGFPDEHIYETLAKSRAKLIVMHCISDLQKAVRVQKTPEEVFDSIFTFFDARLPKLKAAGIAPERMIIDPGMGFFLSSNPEPSLAVLAHIGELKKRYDLPVMVSVSRKSFLKNLAPSDDTDIQSRTLAAELFAATQSVDYIRTHDVRALNQGLQTAIAIESAGSAHHP